MILALSFSVMGRIKIVSKATIYKNRVKKGGKVCRELGRISQIVRIL